MNQLQKQQTRSTRGGRRSFHGIAGAALLAALLCPAPSLAAPVGTASLVLDVQGTLDNFVFCSQSTFANTVYDVFGTPVNLATQASSILCGGVSGVPFHCEAYPDASAFSLDGNASSICNPPDCTAAISFAIENPYNVMGTVPQQIGPATYAFDGYLNNTGFLAATDIPDCGIVGGVFRYVGALGLNAFLSVPTAAGSNVPVSTATTFFNPITMQEIPVTIDLLFSNVTSAGETTVTASSNAAAVLTSSFAAAVGGYQAAFVDITTTATFSGPVTLCSTYADVDDDGFIDGTTVAEGALSLLHEEGDPLTFVDRTVSRDPVNNVICAEVDSFSRFVAAVRVDGLCDAPGEPCDDGDACTTTDVCDGNSLCVGSGAPDCDDGSSCTADSCVSPVGCVYEPAATGCLLALKSRLKLTPKAGNPARDTLSFNWADDSITPQAQFGDPTLTDSYSLCVFDSNGAVLEAHVPAGGTCNDKPCWKALRTNGYSYTDPATAEDGVKRVKLQGGDKPKTKVQLNGKGDALPAYTLPLATPVTAQLIRDASGLCFEVTYDADDVGKNDGVSFKSSTR